MAYTARRPIPNRLAISGTKMRQGPDSELVMGADMAFTGDWLAIIQT